MVTVCGVLTDTYPMMLQMIDLERYGERKPNDQISEDAKQSVC